VNVGASVHVPSPEKLPPPTGSELKLTVPDGVLAVSAAVSVTVAVQAVASLGTTMLGAHDADVAVERAVTTHVNTALPATPCESVTVIVTSEVPAVVAVPEMTPLTLLIDRPAGSPVAE